MFEMSMTDDKSEIVAYNTGNLPIKSCFSLQADYPTLGVINHWHTDFEFTYVTKGKMNYFVNGTEYELSEGQMIFVNSAQMHYSLWRENGNGEFICEVIHPSVYENRTARRYVEEITAHGTPPFLIFSPQNFGEKEMIDLICEIYSAATSGREGFELDIMSSLYALLRRVHEHISGCDAKPYSADAKKLETMHRMVGFIQKNYQNKLSLEDIANSGMVCRSGCCEIFRHFLGKTPVEYLNEYRISKSIELLSSSELNMTDISAACGFGGSSYFTEIFRRLMGCTPSDYRRTRREQ